MTQATASLNPKERAASYSSRQAHIMVFGNEKGGSGKSTAAIHVAIGLLYMGYQVGTIDLDARQGTLTRYLKNRFEFIARTKKMLLSPMHMAIHRSEAQSLEEREREEYDFLIMAVEELRKTCDFVIIDTPGADSNLSRMAHGYADTLMTPVNDSFIDLDVLADIDPNSLEIRAPSVYAKLVADEKEPDQRWIVLRNRLSPISAENKRNVGNVLEKIAPVCGFEIAPGFSERVIFRELFLKGLTLLDLQKDPENKLTLSQVAARQEMRNLMMALAPETLKPLPGEKTAENL